MIPNRLKVVKLKSNPLAKIVAGIKQKIKSQVVGSLPDRGQSQVGIEAGSQVCLGRGLSRFWFRPRDSRPTQLHCQPEPNPDPRLRFTSNPTLIGDSSLLDPNFNLDLRSSPDPRF
ncbi:hypothetical protein HAX54_048033 [Datura stramonium]|uniref:Uncharacterized protein n=1 Tax=Datura stramonium TaxID=4076 RepID=A0ABS8STU0_DATST|nr:hypothetical protein [Datura stramonium]